MRAVANAIVTTYIYMGYGSIRDVFYYLILCTKRLHRSQDRGAVTIPPNAPTYYLRARHPGLFDGSHLLAGMCRYPCD